MPQDYQTFLQSLPPDAQAMLNPNDPVQLTLWQRLDSMPQEYVSSLMQALTQSEEAMEAFNMLVPELAVFFDTGDMQGEAENAGGEGGMESQGAGMPGQMMAQQQGTPMTTAGVAQPQNMMEEEYEEGGEMPQQGNTPAGRMPRSGLRGIFAGS